MKLESISKEFIKRWEVFYGKYQTEKIVANLKKQDPRIIAPNELKISLFNLKQNLEKKGFRLEHTNLFNALIVDNEPFNIVATPEYLAGQFSVQALTSLIPPKCLQLSKTNIVADLAAAPGIKTCLLAQQMKNQGTIIAIEKSKTRISALKANLARMGVWNTLVFNFDSTMVSRMHIQFDHILLDAPCSGTGLKISKNKKLSSRKLHDIFRHMKQQKIILDQAWKLLKPEGTLVYSVCSLEPEEGENQISNFLKKHSFDAILLQIPHNIGIKAYETNWTEPLDPQLSHALRIFPDVGFDGFFIAIIKKMIS